MSLISAVLFLLWQLKMSITKAIRILSELVPWKCVCVCVCFHRIWASYMNLFRSSAPFCNRPLPLPRLLFCQFALTANQLFFVPWLNLSTKSCASLWMNFYLEVMHLFAKAHSRCSTPFFNQLAWTHTHTHTHTHTLPCQILPILGKDCGFQLVRSFCGPTDRQSDN